MHIFVNLISGKTIEVDASTVCELSSQIESTLGIPIERQKLLSNGELLTDENLSENIHLLINLKGETKGKKKKKAKKKKKVKHHHKNINLRLLNTYKVEGDKVVRLRQMCKVCPPGTYLADHEDRLYCGRCHMTFKRTQELGESKKVKKAKGGATKKEAPKVEETKPTKVKKGKK